MKWFLNLATRNKLFIGFGLMIVFLATVIATAYQGVTTIQAAQRKLYQEEFANAVDLLNLRANENGVRAALLNMMAADKQADQETWHEDIKQRSKEISGATQRLLERNRNNPSMIAQLVELNKTREAFAQTRDDRIIPLIYAGKERKPENS